MSRPAPRSLRRSKFPLHFDALFCNLVAAGEQAGILETLLDRLANYKEKILAIKSKIKSALFYPVAIIVVAFIITAVIMIFVIPAFKQVFTSFGADLPAPTLLVMGISDFFVKYWYIIFPAVIGGVWGFLELWQRSIPVQIFMDRWSLKVPVFGDLIRKSSIARWTRTLATMFAAGVPLVEALDSRRPPGTTRVPAGHEGDQRKVSTGISLTTSMQNRTYFEHGRANGLYRRGIGLPGRHVGRSPISSRPRSTTRRMRSPARWSR
jgi:type IV pilus assembly protein PilC